jgi:beta-lactam-binding protein with PASTA domain
MGPLQAVVERAGRIDPGDRYPDAATMEAALADSIETLERPEALVLPGVADADDPHPTQAVNALGKAEADATGRLFDQDAAAEAIAIDFVPIGATRTLRGRLGLPPLTAAQRSRQRRLVPLAVLVVLAVATMLGTSALAQVGASGRPSPGLVGLTQVDAGEAAQKAGLTLHVIHRSSPDPNGVVIDQNPAAGAWLYGGRTVDVVVSSGPSKVSVPDLTGMTPTDAKAKLRSVGLLGEGTHKFHQTAKAGTVFEQTPNTGRLQPGKTVRYVWSDGPPPKPIPDVHGFTCKAAIDALDNVHLVGVCKEVYDDKVLEHVVIGTVPGAGVKHAQDRNPITINVSKGPQLVKVPDVVDMKVNDAITKLRDLGFKVTVPNYNPKGHVFAQSPAGGEIIKKGSEITLFL